MNRNNFWESFWKAVAIYGISVAVDFFATEIKKNLLKEIV
jgi:hypothetical protein